MKFIFSDSLDYVDPNFDFLHDLHSPGREPYWGDEFPHEIMGYPPYDGMLVSRAVVGDPGRKGKYSDAQSMRFRRIGAREFLRFNKPEHKDMPVFGDCGAFSYSNEKAPPFGAIDTVEFYDEGKFTHGCSIDHIIFDFFLDDEKSDKVSTENIERYEITLQLAAEFKTEAKRLGKTFTPVGVVQGWSPLSMANAARDLIGMGYRYIAIGGLVPLRSPDIHRAVTAVQDAVSRWPSVKIHLLGFAKADQLHEFSKYSKVYSFDSSSPLIRAFKDKSKNYYLPNKNNGIDYYSAIRIPQAIENLKLVNHAKAGRYRQEDLIALEKDALYKTRAFAKKDIGLDETLAAIIKYSRPLQWTTSISDDSLERKTDLLRVSYQKTLEDRPWEKCKCNICKNAGVETIIFRASNRNKRRGIHNLGVYHNHLKSINEI